MARNVQYSMCDWAPGWFQFRLRPDPTVTIFDLTYHCQAGATTGEPPLPISDSDFPPSFSVTDRRTLNTILEKLTEEISKVVLNATEVHRVEHIYYEGPPPPP